MFGLSWHLHDKAFWEVRSEYVQNVEKRTITRGGGEELLYDWTQVSLVWIITDKKYGVIFM